MTNNRFVTPTFFIIPAFFAIPTFFVIPTQEGSAIREQQFQATNLYSLMRCFNGIAFMHAAQMLPSSA